MLPHERKAALGHGAQARIKAKTREIRPPAGYSIGLISEVVSGKAPPTKDARAVAVIAARMIRKPVAIAFPEYARRAV